MQPIAPAFRQLRALYRPPLPAVLKLKRLALLPEESGPRVQPARIREAFPNTFDLPVVRVGKGSEGGSTEPLTVGVVLSGGPAPGGHNVIAGLFDALKAANPASRLFGFRNGPKGVVTGAAVELTEEMVDDYRNTGGFDLIGTGRDKIEKVEDMESCLKSMKGLGMQALVVVGGDDSNTNAAVLAEYFLAQKAGLQVIGVPKTIDGDLRNRWIEMSFGFDTAAKTYAELVGNVCRDAMSSVKYWHFIKLMGRSASHVALEVALQTHPNLTLVSEEVEARQLSLAQVVDEIVDVIVRRAKAGRDYGVILIPEGLLQFVPEVKALLKDLTPILKEGKEILKHMPETLEKSEYAAVRLPEESAAVYRSMPLDMRLILLKADSHGHPLLSQVETDKLLAVMAAAKMQRLRDEKVVSAEFSPLTHFFGYEGRCGTPSNFDATYAYVLGYTAAQLVRGGLTAYTVSARNLVGSVDEWVLGGVPVSAMLTIEERSGAQKAVIERAVVDLNGPIFKEFAAARDRWAVENAYALPGPIQFFGPAEITDVIPLTLQLAHQGSGA